jgi:hypothetical protein
MRRIGVLLPGDETDPVPPTSADVPVPWPYWTKG